MTDPGSLTVLGVDPGTASTGYGVVKARGQRLAAVCGGVVSTAASAPAEQRLAGIAESLEELIAAHRPAAVAIEDIFFSRNVRTAFAVGQARGVALAAAGRARIPCFTYTPQAVKLAVCGAGAGQAPKEQVQRMVTTLLGLERPPGSDHAADALAVAICHTHSAPARAAAQQAASREGVRLRSQNHRP